MSTKLAYELNTGGFRARLTGTSARAPQGSRSRILRWVQIALSRMRCRAIELVISLTKDNERTGEGCNSLDELVKSVRILTVKVPNRPEGWAFFFASLERAYVSKNLPEKVKSEILLNLLGEKASNVLTYVKDDELNNYELKSIVLREYEPSANQFLEQFKKSYASSK
ncbi:integrase catalytic domain-containing protein [Trichonephila clavipes]|nr:integrase catalytic domain-containing protein [Trichonephila clavipes]